MREVSMVSFCVGSGVIRVGRGIRRSKGIGEGVVFEGHCARND